MFFSKWKLIGIILCSAILIALSLPNFFDAKWLPAALNRKVNYGLDLRGGVQVLLKIDFNAYLYEQLDLTSDLIRKALRKEKVGYTHLRVDAGKVSFILRDKQRADVAKRVINKIDRDLNVEFDDNRARVYYSGDRVTQIKGNLVDQTIEIIRYRIDETGTLEPSIQRQGELGILLQVPGLYDPDQLKRLLGKTAKLTFHLIDEEASLEDAMRGNVPHGSRLLPGEENEHGQKMWHVVKERVVVTGDTLTNAQLATNPQTNQPVVAFMFNTLGARLFGDVTSKNAGKRLAIVLDDKVISAPVVNEPILSGSGTISGNFTVSSANELALLLRAGALPAPLTIAEERVVGPSLGEDSIAFGKKSGMVAILAVVVFMVLVYGYLGMFASIAVVCNLIFIISIMGLLQATLTMPGIAGMVLTMGMAVDTNVLIFERIREELQVNSTAQYAIKRGFEQAFATILDSNLTTLIAAFFLYVFGSGIIKGFAVTLTIGILSSMFTAITLTKLLIHTWINFVVRRKKA